MSSHAYVRQSTISFTLLHKFLFRSGFNFPFSQELNEANRIYFIWFYFYFLCFSGIFFMCVCSINFHLKNERRLCRSTVTICSHYLIINTHSLKPTEEKARDVLSHCNIFHVCLFPVRNIWIVIQREIPTRKTHRHFRHNSSFIVLFVLLAICVYLYLSVPWIFHLLFVRSHLLSFA